MAYSTSLAARVRDAVQHHPGVTEKKMFGGVGFLLHGNMLVGIWKESLIVRLDPEQGATALTQPHVSPMDITGRPMRGWLMVAPAGLDEDRDLQSWISRAIQFVKGLEPQSAVQKTRSPKSKPRKPI